ncbi:MAG: GxxExxY protein [Candidatus Parcubacteria bacterium]|nr:GxxExxY protein [Candidatus Parcubacteria bacterium]
MKPKLIRKDLIYPDLSYEITGILFDVFKELGPGHKEKYYQNAIYNVLIQKKYDVQRELHVPLNYKGIKVGSYYLDFLIENKIILEIKKGDYFKKTNIDQIYQYLKATNLQLGILAQFTGSGVRTKRILNIYP